MKTFCSAIPDNYLNRWLTVEECRELAEEMAVPSLDKENKNTSKTMTWNALKDCLPAVGYAVEAKKGTVNKKRVQLYKITGMWHDAEIEDNEFLQLVEARLEGS